MPLGKSKNSPSPTVAPGGFWVQRFSTNAPAQDTRSGVLILDNRESVCQVGADPAYAFWAKTSSGGAAVGGGALSAADSLFLGTLLQWDTINLPTNVPSYTVVRTYTTNVTILHRDTGESGQSTANYRCTVIIQHNAAPLEAVIFPDPPVPVPIPVTKYADWIPAGGADEDTPGTNFTVTVLLRPKGSQDTIAFPSAAAQWSFQLNDVSKEPGICLNFPAKGQAQNPPKPDLRISQTDDLLPVENDGLNARTARADLNATGVTLDCFDYGAYGKLTVIASIPGQGDVKAFVADHPDQDFLTLPQDENLNHIADAWEKAEGRFIGYDTDPACDCADKPSGQACDGDGISLYERYRGFKTKQGWTRLKAHPKYVFVRDQDGLLLETMSNGGTASSAFPSVTQCKVIFLDPDQWTGSGMSDSARVVNFNTSGFGHATDQHGILLVANNSPNPQTPAAWRNAYNSGLPPDKQVDAKVSDMMLGQTLAAPGADPKSPDSPASVYECVIYLGNFPNFLLDMVKYHTAGLLKFQPMLDANSFHALPPEVQDSFRQELAANANAYISSHDPDLQTWYPLMLNLIVTHELCHAVGAAHHEREFDGDWNCVMRYFQMGFRRDGDFPRTPDDRFEIGLRKIWPNGLCAYGNGNPSGSCWKTIRVTDKR